MLVNYITAAIRNFNRNKLIFIINLFGLAIGLATCLIAALYVKHEYQTDQFHRDIQSIYRIHTTFKTWNFSGTPYLLTENLEQDFAPVTASLRLSTKKAAVRIGEDDFNHEVLMSDPNFFSFFTFPLLRGNSHSVLNSLHQVVISDEMNKKYFAGQEPVGQSIQLKLNGQFMNFEITGVAAAPSYSSIHFDFIIPLENHFADTDRKKDDWENLFATAFVKIDKNKLNEVMAGMPVFIKNYLGNNADGNVNRMSFVFSPFSQHHLSEGMGGSGMKEGRGTKALLVFAGIALVILVLACFNFMNLATAQSSRRVLEIGIRKIAGAGRLQLVRQFLVESVLIAIIASLLAMGLAELSLFAFRDLLQATLSVFSKENVDIYFGLLVITVLTGVLAGSYPAMVLSAVNVLSAFKKHFKLGGSNFLTRLVLSVQFMVTIILIASAFVMWRQQNFMLHKDLGFNQEQILVVSVSPADRASVQLLQNKLKQVPEVVNVAKTSGSFTRGNSASLVQMPDESRVIVFMESIDADYLSTMQMKLVDGEGFSETKTYDPTTIIVNEAFTKKFDLRDSLGIKLGRSLGIPKPTIIGVVKDFHNNSLHSEIEPFFFRAWNASHAGESFLMIRLAGGEIAQGLDKIKALWSAANPNSPFEFFFMDDDVARQYASDVRWFHIITSSTGIAIFLSVLGLVGLATFTTAQLKKEIGIRKVLGASVRNIIGLLSKNYLMLITIAFIVAVPLSYYAMSQYWLNSFIYRVEIGAMVYVMAFVLVFLVVGLAVGSITVRAALQNPADTLKEE